MQLEIENKYILSIIPKKDTLPKKRKGEQGHCDCLSFQKTINSEKD
jgi:hypothetical protein